MTDSSSDTSQIAERTLTLTRVIDAPPARVFQAWTDPELIKQWFVPRPWSIAHAETDVRAGGKNIIVMRDPEGNEYPNHGIYLEVVPNQRLVVTDAYVNDWEPTNKPFMTAILTFEPIEDGSKTQYTAKAMHWSKADREQHEKMGFHEGWGICADQLNELLTR